jgi:hypothetical protein
MIYLLKRFSAIKFEKNANKSACNAGNYNEHGWQSKFVDDFNAGQNNQTNQDQ